MPKECLPDHLKDAKHTDWLWPLSLLPRSINAFCGLGPVWTSQHQKPVPLPGYSSYHTRDIDGSYRPYYAKTFKNGLHFRLGFRWDDVDFYYNYIIFTAGFEYRDGEPV
jgi:hypothetical protein